MTNEERARQIVIEWDRSYRWRADENSPHGARFPKLQEMIREALDKVGRVCTTRDKVLGLSKEQPDERRRAPCLGS